MVDTTQQPTKTSTNNQKVVTVDQLSQMVDESEKMLAMQQQVIQNAIDLAVDLVKQDDEPKQETQQAASVPEAQQAEAVLPVQNSVSANTVQDVQPLQTSAQPSVAAQPTKVQSLPAEPSATQS